MMKSASTTVANPPPPVTDLQALKSRQQVAWSSGDYAVVGTTLQIVGEELCEAADLAPGASVLDVAGGNGNVSLAAARRFCEVTCTDYVPVLLERARQRAEAEGLDITFEQADAEALPFADASFDAVVSTFGVMFTPDQDRAAHELLRVCRPGGTIGLANWTPDGFIGRLFGIIGRYLPPPQGVKSPALWGTKPRIVELFSAGTSDIRIAPQHFVFRYRSPEHWLHVFKSYYGPLLKAFAALAPAEQAGLEHDLLALVAEFNRGRDGTMAVPSEYVQIVMTSRERNSS